MLKTALTPGAAAEAEGETPLLELAVRQKLAGDGKPLPDAPDTEAGDTDKPEADPHFAWFGTALVLPQPAPLPAPALPRLPAAADAIQLPGSRPAPAAPVTAKPAPIAPAAPNAPADTAAALPSAAPAAPAQAVDAIPAAPATTVAPVMEARPQPVAAADPQPVREQAPAPVRIELPPAHDAAPRPQPVTLAAIQPRPETVQPLAAPLAAAAIEAPAPRRQPREITVSALTPTATTEAPRTHAVPAMADAQQPMLDLRNHASLTTMIERIEALRDAPGIRETSIRLSPDALGTVDVSIRQEGDRVHVHFSAETPAARAALAEAQPRLAELAESRGLRLGQTSIDGGASSHSQGQRHDAAPRPDLPSAPASAQGGAPSTDTDERIA